jgi:hypothetical protein
VSYGLCPLLEEGFTSPFQRVIPSQIFYPCFDLFFQITNRSGSYRFATTKSDLDDRDEQTIEVSNLETLWKPVKKRSRPGRIVGYQTLLKIKRIKNASYQGTQYLTDIQQVQEVAAPEGTYEYDWRHYDYEMFYTFYDEFNLCLGLSILSVIIVVFLVTADLLMTFLVTLMVTLTDFFLIGFMDFWGLTLNGLVIINVILAIGTSVDYSTHIAYAYLNTPVPADCEKPWQIRQYKTKNALR